MCLDLADENEVVLLLSNKHIYQESRGTSFTDKFTAASSPGGGDDSQGVNRISDMPYGEFSPTFAPFIDALYWDDDTQRIILQLRSFIAPGTVNLSFSGLGDYVLAPIGVNTSYTVRGSEYREYFRDVAVDPFQLNQGPFDLTLTATTGISH